MTEPSLDCSYQHPCPRCLEIEEGLPRTLTVDGQPWQPTMGGQRISWCELARISRDGP